MRALIFILILVNNMLCDFSTQTYFNKPASHKMDLLWNKLSENQHSLGFYSDFTVSGIFLEGMKPSFDVVGDEFQAGRKKLIHTVGGVVKAQFISTNDHFYTGIFEGCNNVLIRLSIAKKQDISKSNAKGAADNFAPGMAIKFLRDGFPSANVQAMYSVNGQESWNFFKNNFSNHIPSATGLQFKALGLKFSTATSYIQTVGLRDIAAITEKGDLVPKPIYPFELIFKPAEELRNKYTDEYSTDYMDQLKSVPKGTLLYSVYAISKPTRIHEKIGELRTTSEVISSRWGDESLFFRHNYMDIDLMENPSWKDYVPEFSIFGGNKDLEVKEKKKCPFSK